MMLVSCSGIPPAMMKLMYKGLLKDEKTLREAKITNGTKMMVVGSTLNDVLTIQPPNPKEIKSKKVEQTGREGFKMTSTTTWVCPDSLTYVCIYSSLMPRPTLIIVVFLFCHSIYWLCAMTVCMCVLIYMLLRS